jgi:nicotinamide-nucleotide amidase
MFKSSVMPILREIVPQQSAGDRRIYRIAGMGESLVEEAIGERLLAIPGIELGYCARPGEVDLRVIGAPLALDRADAIIRTGLGNSIVSNDGRSLEELVVNLLTERRQTLAVAESCTGGYLAHRITNVPGASAVFLRGYITYANAAKSEMLGVNASLIEAHGAVSEEVAKEMAQGARREASANFALATTGIAGPDGATPGKPVGTVFIALAKEQTETQARRFQFPEDRPTFKDLTAQAALEMLRQSLLA